MEERLMTDPEWVHYRCWDLIHEVRSWPRTIVRDKVEALLRAAAWLSHAYAGYGLEFAEDEARDIRLIWSGKTF